MITLSDPHNLKAVELHWTSAEPAQI